MCYREPSRGMKGSQLQVCFLTHFLVGQLYLSLGNLFEPRWLLKQDRTKRKGMADELIRVTQMIMLLPPCFSLYKLWAPDITQIILSTIDTISVGGHGMP